MNTSKLITKRLTNNRPRTMRQSPFDKINLFEVVFYVKQIHDGIKTIEDIPQKYREAVEQRLAKYEEHLKNKEEAIADDENND